MHVLGVVGSPRKGGNTDLLMDRALEGARSCNALTEKVYLGDLRIAPCLSCLACEESGQCAQVDDMHALYPKIARAEAIILGTPVYFWGPTAQAKAFVDRWYVLQLKRAALRGKRMALVSPYADPDPRTPSRLFAWFEELVNNLEMELVGTLGAVAGGRGEVARDEEALNRAFHLGKMLASR